MLASCALAAVLCVAAPPSFGAHEGLLRQIIGETAVAQVRQISADWEPVQRDCAGLVRYAYRKAFARLQPGRAPWWQDSRGQPVSFADAATLIRDNFVSLGRDDEARGVLRTGDLLAFRQDNTGGEPTYHLMLMVAAVTGRSSWVVYHPGEPQATVRWGRLRDLDLAPSAWRPSPGNPAFLGYLRFKEWAHGDS